MVSQLALFWNILNDLFHTSHFIELKLILQKRFLFYPLYWNGSVGLAIVLFMAAKAKTSEKLIKLFLVKHCMGLKTNKCSSYDF